MRGLEIHLQGSGTYHLVFLAIFRTTNYTPLSLMVKRGWTHHYAFHGHITAITTRRISGRLKREWVRYKVGGRLVKKG